jgi:hypothetical protein
LENSENEKVRELSIIACLENVRGIGPVKFRQIIENYKSYSPFWKIVTAITFTNNSNVCMFIKV